MAAFPAFRGDRKHAGSTFASGPLPPKETTEGPYEIDFARNADDLEAIQRLRFEVFNVEMEEGLATSVLTGRDEDDFDATCDHLFVRHRASGAIVGTYRMQTVEKALDGNGFYAATEYDMTAMPPEVLQSSVEIGRACIHKDHRSLSVLYLLWKGLGQYASFHRKRYLFGCCSLTSQLPEEGWVVYDQLKAGGHLHPDLKIMPLASHACERADTLPDDVRPPRLMRTYLSLGAHICSDPAIDREFKTIDFLAIFDFESLQHSDLAFYRFRS